MAAADATEVVAVRDESPLAARIVSVCDAYQAMITARAYGTASTRPEAVAELRKNAGTQFDPKVVDAFVNEGAKRAFGPTLHVEGDYLFFDGWWQTATRGRSARSANRRAGYPRLGSSWWSGTMAKTVGGVTWIPSRCRDAR